VFIVEQFSKRFTDTLFCVVDCFFGTHSTFDEVERITFTHNLDGTAFFGVYSRYNAVAFCVNDYIVCAVGDSDMKMLYFFFFIHCLILLFLIF